MATAIVCDHCERVQAPDEILEWYQVRQDGERHDFCCRICLLAYEALAELARQDTPGTRPDQTVAGVTVLLGWLDGPRWWVTLGWPPGLFTGGNDEAPTTLPIFAGE